MTASSDKRKLKPSISIHQLIDTEFKEYLVDEKWEQIIGIPEQNFRMLIWGPSGSGKTTFGLMLAKYFAINFGKVYYNSSEQGKSSALKKAAIRLSLGEIPAGRMKIGNRDTFDDFVEKIKRTHPRFIFIDSLQYFNLTEAQYKLLIKLFPTRAFIIISWEKSGEPKGEYAKSIRYMVDIKCYVNKGVAECESRFGATEPYRVIPKKVKTGEQLSLLNSN